jgi:hypothetical protein
MRVYYVVILVWTVPMCTGTAAQWLGIKLGDGSVIQHQHRDMVFRQDQIILLGDSLTEYSWNNNGLAKQLSGMVVPQLRS